MIYRFIGYIQKLVRRAKAIRVLKKQLKSDEPRNTGICEILGQYYPIMEIEKLMRDWPKHSGSYVYPVPHDYYDPGTAYHRGIQFEKLWSTEDRYGQLRRDLTRHVIRKLRKGL